MKVLIDTNVILDVFCNRKNFVEYSSKVFKLCEVNKIKGYISALSISNIIYILRKELDEEKIKEILDNLYLIFQVVDLKAEDFKKAVNLEFNDFEDALQCVSAINIKADYIVTRNLKDYSKSKILAITPYDLIKKYKF